VVEAIEDLHPVAVASTFPLSGDALAAVTRAGIPQFHLGSNRSGALAALNQIVGDLQVDHLIARGHRKLAFVYSDAANLRMLGNYWLNAIQAAAAERQLPDVTVETVATEGTDAADVVQRLVRADVTAVCAHSGPTAFVLLHGLRQAGLRCPGDLAVIGIEAGPIGYVSDPPLTSIEFDEDTILDTSAQAFMGALGFAAPTVRAERPVARLVQRNST